MVPLEELTFPQLLMRTAKRCGQRPAVWYRSETMTYNRLARQVEAYGAALCAGGIRKGTVTLPFMHCIPINIDLQ